MTFLTQLFYLLYTESALFSISVICLDFLGLWKKKYLKVLLNTPETCIYFIVPTGSGYSANISPQA